MASRLLFLFVLVVLGGCLVAGVARSGRRIEEVTAPTPLAEAVRAMRGRANARVLLVTVAAGGIGFAALLAGFAVEWGTLALALAALAAAGAGSLTVAAVRPPTEAPTSVRSAELTPRTSRGFGPRWAFAIPSALAAGLVALLLASALTSSPSDDGRGHLEWSAPGISGSVAPYPGWQAVLPLLLLLGAAAGAYLFALHRVAAWPRPTEPDLYGFDDEVRRASTRMLLFGASGALLTATGTVAFVAGRAWHAVAANVRMNGGPELGQAATLGPWTFAGDSPSPLEQAIDAVWSVAAISIPVGITFMFAALVAGWVHSPRLVELPVAHR
jgi:MFS family permease